MKALLIRLALLVVAGVLSLSLSAWADTLELKDGRVIQGKYVRGTPANIHFVVDGKVKIFPVAEVSALIFGEEGEARSKSAAAPPPPPPPPPPEERSSAKAPATRAATPPRGTVTVPAGTRLEVRMIDGVDSDTNKVGDRFRASLEEDLVLDGRVVLAKGTDVYGRLVEVKEAGRIAGRSELKLELTDILIQQQLYPIVTGDYEVSGKSRGADSAKKIGGGAAIGAVIGGIAGGGKGAAIGAGIGAGAGTTIQVLTRGEQVRVPSETLLEFTLEEPVTLRTSRSTTR